jgi:hypothetical protein
MSGCQPCAPADGVLIVSVRVLEYLCWLCGRHVACCYLPMSGCQPCAPADGVLIVSVRVLECLCCLCGRHVAYCYP